MTSLNLAPSRFAGPRDHHEVPLLQLASITARRPDGHCILDDVSLSIERGWLVAVMGPTGAGKTSLVRTLTGSLRLDAGEIRLDDRDLTCGSGALRRRVGYVPQEDLLYRQLGLRRSLEYKASLRLPSATGAVQRSRRVSDVLAELGLECQGALAIAALSGGQRKRANLAVELLAQPDVLVLDEPTTGLDPGHERSVMTTLRGIADRGRTVLTVTHSMSAMRMCDRVVFLAAGGQVAFFGTPAGAVAYFAQSDAADLFVALDSPAEPSWKERWCSQRVQLPHSATGRGTVMAGSHRPRRTWEPAGPIGSDPSSAAAAHVGAPTPSHPVAGLPGGAGQLVTLVRRYLDLIRSDRRHVAMLALQAPALGLLLWAVLAPGGLSPVPLPGALRLADPSAVKVAVFLSIGITWMGTASAIREIVKERQILHRERGAGLSLSAYVASKAVVLGSLVVVQAAVFTAIACIRQAPPAHGAVLGWGLGEIILATAVTGLAAVSLGLAISALAGTPDKAMTILPIALVAQLVLSGAWGSVTSVPGITQLSDLTGAYWGVKAIEASVAGNAHAWWSAMVVLSMLTAGTLVATACLVQARLSRRGRCARGGI